MTIRPLVIVESPFAGDEAANLLYLRRCLRDSWERGEMPFASHAFFPFFLKESDPKERMEGIEAGYSFWSSASKIIFYIDRGRSAGMILAQIRAQNENKIIETRSIGEL